MPCGGGVDDDFIPDETSTTLFGGGAGAGSSFNSENRLLFLGSAGRVGGGGADAGGVCITGVDTPAYGSCIGGAMGRDIPGCTDRSGCGCCCDGTDSPRSGRTGCAWATGTNGCDVGATARGGSGCCCRTMVGGSALDGATRCGGCC